MSHGKTATVESAALYEAAPIWKTRSCMARAAAERRGEKSGRLRWILTQPLTWNDGYLLL
jgi:hypothetical protein